MMKFTIFSLYLLPQLPARIQPRFFRRGRLRTLLELGARRVPLAPHTGPVWPVDNFSALVILLSAYFLGKVHKSVSACYCSIIP